MANWTRRGIIGSLARVAPTRLLAAQQSGGRAMPTKWKGPFPLLRCDPLAQTWLPWLSDTFDSLNRFLDRMLARAVDNSFIQDGGFLSLIVCVNRRGMTC
jgi:hypothetical protein